MNFQFTHVKGRHAYFVTETGRQFRKDQAKIDKACETIDCQIFPHHVAEYRKATYELKLEAAPSPRPSIGSASQVFA